MLYSTIAKGVTNMLTWQRVNRYILRQIENYMYHELVIKGQRQFPRAMQRKKYLFLRSMLYRLFDGVNDGTISEDVISTIIRSLVLGSFHSSGGAGSAQQTFRQRYGMNPPHFLVVSPTEACNLNCTGCYAASPGKGGARLPYDVFERIVHEAYTYFGCRFMTISGGEPFLYKDSGKSLLDIFERYRDMYFLVFTNGTCLDEHTVRTLATLGNVTPAISVEGYEKETDERRGTGTFGTIMKSMERLRGHGVPFGVSVTATRKNVDLLLDKRFYEYYIDRQRANYIWQFQLMPIGAAHDQRQLMVTPKQRLKLYRMWEYLIEEGYPVADFWNSGMLSNGCLAYGRPGGYLYINWHGQVMPCVFVPYHVHNIKEVFEQGGYLSDVLFSEFFKNGREWQWQYGLKDPKNADNWLMPCSIRDHYDTFKHNILTPDAAAENDQARQARQSAQYTLMLKRYDDTLDGLTRPVWREEFVK